MTDPNPDNLPLCALQPLAIPLRTETLTEADVPKAPVRPGLKQLISQRRLLVEEVARTQKVAPPEWPERTELKARRAERELKPILTERRLFGRPPIQTPRPSVDLECLDA